MGVGSARWGIILPVGKGFVYVTRQARGWMRWRECSGASRSASLVGFYGRYGYINRQ